MDVYNWINQLSNTTIWWLDICCLLHRYQLHVSAAMAIFRLIDWQQTCKQLYFGMRFVYGGGGLGLDGGTRSRVCWVGRVMWVHGYYCAGLRPKFSDVRLKQHAVIEFLTAGKVPSIEIHRRMQAVYGWSLVQRSPTECGVSLCVYLDTSWMRRSWPALGRSTRN